MLDLYYGPTPNAQKISIALEELGIPYLLHAVDVLAGDQFKPDFLAISPNNKMPVIVDPDGPGGSISVWESGAILLYLGEKAGRLIPADPRRRIEMMKWLMFQMAGVGPMGGQLAFFAVYCRERLELPTTRYRNEIARQMRVMDKHLSGVDYFAGEYSVADIAVLPWWLLLKKLVPGSYPALDAWEARLTSRPAVQKGLSLMAQETRKETIAGGGVQAGLPEETYRNLYGEGQWSAGR